MYAVREGDCESTSLHECCFVCCCLQIGDAVSKWNYILFIALEVVGTLFVIHLITAVLYIRFEQTKSEELKKYQRCGLT